MPAGDVTITPVVESNIPSHTISYVVLDSSNNTLEYSKVISSDSVLPVSAKEGATVNLSVVTTTKYEFKGIRIGEGSLVENASTSFEMGTSDVVVTIIADEKEGGEDYVFGGEYKYVIPMSNPAYNNTYTLTFNSDGTGSYIRTRLNSEGLNTVGVLYFTYTKDDDNKITVTLTKYGTKMDIIHTDQVILLADIDYSQIVITPLIQMDITIQKMALFILN